MDWFLLLLFLSLGPLRLCACVRICVGVFVCVPLSEYRITDFSCCQCGQMSYFPAKSKKL